MDDHHSGSEELDLVVVSHTSKRAVEDFDVMVTCCFKIALCHVISACRSSERYHPSPGFQPVSGTVRDCHPELGRYDSFCLKEHRKHVRIAPRTYFGPFRRGKSFNIRKFVLFVAYSNKNTMNLKNRGSPVKTSRIA